MEKYINKKEVLNIIFENFNQISATLPNRSVVEQNIIGNFITVLESEIKHDIKKLKEIEL